MHTPVQPVTVVIDRARRLAIVKTPDREIFLRDVPVGENPYNPLQQVNAALAQLAYRKKYHPGISAMCEGARRDEFEVLYVHKVDHLARRRVNSCFTWSARWASSIATTLSKETNKGKLERSLQGYHNSAVPWGYVGRRRAQTAA